ncbi:signal peptidase I [Candidatus Berkelbacteria bacterium]|nr:signal peptidase I [Candidatus Berkelbacteria bacterium]
MRILGSIVSSLSWVILGIALLVALSGLPILPGGYRTMAVVSGSMEPALAVGSLVLTQQMPDPSLLKIGDVISFQQPGAPDRIITHRIASIETVGATQFFRTQGDANPTLDSWKVSYGQIVGKVVRDAPSLGSLMQALRTPWAVATFVWIPVLALAFHELYKIHTILMELQLEHRRSLA